LDPSTIRHLAEGNAAGTRRGRLTVSLQIDPRTQALLLAKAVGFVLPMILALCGLLAAWSGQTDDLIMVAGLIMLCGVGWAGYALHRLLTSARRPEEQDWPTGQL